MSNKHACTYRWADLAIDRPMPLIERQRIIGEKMMISRVVLSKGFKVSSHHHENEQISVMVSGRTRFGLGVEGTREHRYVELTGGEVVHMPPNVPHSAEALEESVILDLFSPPSDKTGIDAGRH